MTTETQKDLVSEAVAESKMPRTRKLLLILGVLCLILMILTGVFAWKAYVPVREQAQSGTSLAKQVQDACKANATNTDDLKDLCNRADKVVDEAPPAVTQGKTGDTGAAGPIGFPGLTGPQGEPGIQGEPGRNGTNGTDGVNGKNGLIGAAGKDGPPGPAGPAGQDGKDGVQGAPGEKGEKGERGEAGAQGPPGPTCPDGYTGSNVQVETGEGITNDDTRNIFACIPN